MANVLIGIIGVILFIGLALAAVTFLGGQFAIVSASSIASASIAEAQQVAEAANGYKTNQGAVTATADIAPQLVANSYLKAVPNSPVSNGAVPALMTATGMTSGGTADFAVIDIGSYDLACAQVNVRLGQQGSTATSPVNGTNFPANTLTGCFKAATGAAAGFIVGDDYVFSSI